MLKKLSIITVAIFVLISILTINVNASDDFKIKLEEVQKSSKIELENGQGILTKTITELDSENSEATIELELKNTAQNDLKEINAELFFVIDNSR